MRTEILYADEQVVVAYKPAGLATQTAKVGQPDMVSELKNHMKNAYLGVVHRLDQPVEGVLVFGRTKEATAALNRQLTQGTLHKRYRAVICGKPDIAASGGEGTLTDYLRKTSDGRAEVVAEKDISRNDAKQAVLRYKILSGRSVENTSITICLADICIETGRFHQIRAQMSHAGMPLLGDSKYGDGQSLQVSTALQARNVALCACELQFIHPATHKQMEFRIEPKGEIFHGFFEKFPK